MTTEQTEDELTRKRRMTAQTAELADAITSAAGAIAAMRQDGLTSRMIVRQALEELRGAFPTEATILHDDSMIDALSGILELLGVMLRPEGPSTDSARRLMGLMEGDPMFAGVVAKMESAIDRFTTGTAVPFDQLPPAPPPPSPPPTWATIQRLFKEHPSPLPDQAPAIECGVVLRGLPVTLIGALSETPEGGLRLLSPDPSQERPIRPGTPVKMYEQFFDYEDVMVVGVRRTAAVEAPRIIQS